MNNKINTEIIKKHNVFFHFSGCVYKRVSTMARNKMQRKLARVDAKVLKDSEIILDNISFQYYVGRDNLNFVLKNMDEEQFTSDGLTRTLTVYLVKSKLNANQEKEVTDFATSLVQAEAFFKANNRIPYTAAKLYLTRLLNQLPNVHFEQKENNSAPPSKSDMRIQSLGPNVKFHVTKTPRAGIENAFDFNFKSTGDYLTSLQGNHKNLEILFTFLSDPQNKAKIQSADIENIEKLLKKLKVPFSRWTSTYQLVHSFDGSSIMKKATYEDFIEIIKIAAFLARKN